MTIIEAIQVIDSLKPNSYSEAEKIQWLSKLDGTIKAEIIDTHEGDEKGAEFNSYDMDTPLDTQLLVPAPYDGIYKSWLESRIDYANGEYSKYNNSVTVFNTDYLSYQKAYNRTHMPKGNSIKFF